ncbi:hypothetical protein ABVT39_019303 [Epinephelus coioides]
MLIIFYILLVLNIGRCTDDHIFETKTVGVGQSVTLTCPHERFSLPFLFWIRLVSGTFPEILGATYAVNLGVDVETRRITAKQGPGTFVLHITETQLRDTAVYYCIKVNKSKMTFLRGTFLRIKGPEPDITAITQDPSDPVRPGDSVTLQCSVLSDSEKKTCPEEHRVYWFRAASDESHPSFIYAQVNSSDGCEKSPEAHSLQKCIYSFSKDVSSSDAGTYYCAVATCGEILFGNRTKLDVEDAVVPVTTVQLGEPVTLTCVLPNDKFNDRLHWYKQSAGETLKLIVRLRKHVNPVYGPEFSAVRLDVKVYKSISSLSIWRTIQEDDCAVMEWTEITWSGTYLSLKGNMSKHVGGCQTFNTVLYHTGNTQRTSNYAVVPWPTVSDPVRPEASMSLQCSVLSDSENKMCPGDHSVFWFRAGSDKSHPDIIYTDGNRIQGFKSSRETEDLRFWVGLVRSQVCLPSAGTV